MSASDMTANQQSDLQSLYKKWSKARNNHTFLSPQHTERSLNGAAKVWAKNPDMVYALNHNVFGTANEVENMVNTLMGVEEFSREFGDVPIEVLTVENIDQLPAYLEQEKYIPVKKAVDENGVSLDELTRIFSLMIAGNKDINFSNAGTTKAKKTAAASGAGRHRRGPIDVFVQENGTRRETHDGKPLYLDITGLKENGTGAAWKPAPAPVRNSGSRKKHLANGVLFSNMDQVAHLMKHADFAAAHPNFAADAQRVMDTDAQNVPPPTVGNATVVKVGAAAPAPARTLASPKAAARPAPAKTAVRTTRPTINAK